MPLDLLRALRRPRRRPAAIVIALLAVGASALVVAGRDASPAIAAAGPTHTAGQAALMDKLRRTPRPTPTPTPTPAPTPTPTPTSTSTPVPTPTPPPPPAGYAVSGNVIVDSTGRPWYAHGLDRPSLEWDCGGETVNGNTGPIPASDFTTMAGQWHANAVRIPLNQDFWLSSTGATVAPSEACPGYATTVHQAVAAAEAAGLAVILDLHWSDEGNLTSTSVGQKCMPDQNSVTFWRSVATAYASDRNVMFELYNEPHDTPWPVWRNGGTFTCTDGVTYTAAGMQQLTDTVRAAGAQNVVVVGGNRWAFDLGGLPTVGAITGGNVAYATHPYEGSAGDSPSAWDAAFGYLTPSAPVIATEFGTSTCAVDAYDTDILTYFRTHGVSSTAWAWYVGGCAFPSVISSAAGACVSFGCPAQSDIAAYASGSQTVTTPAV
ncbi:MAG TPA: cellulase family glycosylhydrolase, partial [Candidatus Dormibacteraeota bacterium]|nr:cellulase family glycosylhydrolase [Candidatus Dormibacteraeota bacterium]